LKKKFIFFHPHTINKKADRFTYKSAPWQVGVTSKVKITNMELSILSKESEVDNLLKFANERKDDLDFRRIVLIREKKDMSGTVTDIDTELIKVNAKLTASNAILGVLTNSDDVRDETLKKERLDVRRKGLENRREDANVEALVMLEFEMEEIAIRITKTDELIAGLNTRKTEILAG